MAAGKDHGLGIAPVALGEHNKVGHRKAAIFGEVLVVVAHLRFNLEVNLGAVNVGQDLPDLVVLTAQTLKVSKHRFFVPRLR